MFSSRISLLLTLTFVIVQPLAWGQDATTGSIRGSVLDSAGALIPQASIVTVNVGTGMRYTTLSNVAGNFTLDLLPGDYTVRVLAHGMSPQISPQLHVDVGGVSDLEFRLSVAGAQENLTVSAVPAVVETQPSAVSTLLDERAVNEFPLNGRRFSDLALFSPGITQDPRSLNSATNGNLAVGGIRGFQNSFLVDGTDYNNAFFAQARGRYLARMSPMPSADFASPTRAIVWLRRFRSSHAPFIAARNFWANSLTIGRFQPWSTTAADARSMPPSPAIRTRMAMISTTACPAIAETHSQGPTTPRRTSVSLAFFTSMAV